MPPSHTTNFLGIWAALFSSIFSSTSVIFQIKAIAYLSPFIVTSLALILGGLVFFFFFTFSRSLPKLSLIQANLLPLLALIFLRCVAGNFLFVYSLSLTSGIKAMFFTKAEPYFVLFWCWILKRSAVKGRHLLLLIFHVIGAIFLSTGGDFGIGQGQIGDLLILLAMCFSSLSYFYGIDASHALGARTTNAITQLCGGLVLLPLAIIYSPLESWTITSPGWIYLGIHILFFNVIALTLWYIAIRDVDAWIVSALRAVGPIVAAPLAWLFLGETLTLTQIIAAIIVLSTSALIVRENKINKQ